MSPISLKEPHMLGLFQNERRDVPGLRGIRPRRSSSPGQITDQGVRICLDFAVFALDGPGFTTRCCTGSACAFWGGASWSCSRLTIDFLADALHGVLQVLRRTAHPREIVACKG